MTIIDSVPMARVSDPATSQIAARSNTTQKELDRASIIRRVNNCRIDNGRSVGTTSDEHAEAVSRPRDSLSPRYSELHREGVIAINGEKRKTRSGGLAQVYVSINDPGAVPYVRPVTRKELVRQLAEANRQLEAANKKLADTDAFCLLQ